MQHVGARDTRVAPLRAGADVPRALRDDRHVGADDVAGGQETRVVVTASWSPPKLWPTVIVASSQPAALSPATAREKATGSAPPSVMT